MTTEQALILNIYKISVFFFPGKCPVFVFAKK